MTHGIYTLANDVVYDQLVALLNSIEANAGKDLPVCVIPYDDRLERVRAEVAQRPQVFLLEDRQAIADWEEFATRAWQGHHKAHSIWRDRGVKGVYRLNRHRKYCAFNGPFDQFIFFDADTLVMAPLDSVFAQLDEYDWITNDFQHKSDWNFVLDCSEPQLMQLFTPEYLRSRIFCSGWFASRKGIFPPEHLDHLVEKLQAGEAAVMAWQDSDQTLLNYMVLRSDLKYLNLALEPGATGNNWSSQYEVKDHILYDKGRPITYLHYIGMGTEEFSRLCQGEDVAIPYREVFLHYRYLHQPADRPQLTRPSWWLQTRRSLGEVWAQKSRRLQQKLAGLRGHWA